MNMYSRPRFGLADQVADRATVVAEGQHAGRAGVNAQLVLDRYAVHIVALSDLAGRIGQELGHHEQRNALDALWRIRAVAPARDERCFRSCRDRRGDEDLLAEDLVASVGLRFRPRAHCCQVGAGLRFGEVHRTGPLAADHARQVERLLLIRTAQHGASMAPVVSIGHSENAMFEAFHISMTAVDTSFGSPCPPYSGSHASAVQPASANCLVGPFQPSGVHLAAFQRAPCWSPSC